MAAHNLTMPTNRQFQRQGRAAVRDDSARAIFAFLDGRQVNARQGPASVHGALRKAPTGSREVDGPMSRSSLEAG